MTVKHHKIFHRGALVAKWLVWNPGQKTDDTRTMFCHGRNVSGYQISVWE